MVCNFTNNHKNPTIKWHLIARAVLPGTLANLMACTKGRAGMQSRRPAFSETPPGENRMAACRIPAQKDIPCSWMVSLVWHECEKANYDLNFQANCIACYALAGRGILTFWVYSCIIHWIIRAPDEPWWTTGSWWNPVWLGLPRNTGRNERQIPGTIWGGGPKSMWPLRWRKGGLSKVSSPK